MACIHNQRKTRYVDGFFCRGCKRFFAKDSPTYRSTELLSSIWMVLHNLNVKSRQDSGKELPDVLEMRDEIGLDETHTEYETLITKAEKIMTKYGVTADSSTLEI